MTTRYLYIDDEQTAGARPIVEAVQRANAELHIDLRRPEDFSKDIRTATDEEPDGLILDLRLDLVPDENGRVADYRAPSLAQEIRTRASEGGLTDIPIVLWSTQVRLDQSFNRDLTGHDLFDLTYVKEEVAQDPARVSRELIAAADGYRQIAAHTQETRPDNAIMRAALGLGAEPPLDPRIEERFAGKERTTPVHEYARFILQGVILQPGALLDELRLAASLGIAPESSADWAALRDSFSAFAYSGVFSSAYFRWWRSGLDRWWTTLKSGKRSMRLLSARERVELVKASTEFSNLSVAEPIQPGYSDRFTTICEGTKKPLDPADGFRVRGKEPEPWQEQRYVSTYAALERIGYDRGLRVHPLERGRYEELLASVTSGGECQDRCRIVASCGAS